MTIILQDEALKNIFVIFHQGNSWGFEKSEAVIEKKLVSAHSNYEFPTERNCTYYARSQYFYLCVPLYSSFNILIWIWIPERTSNQNLTFT